MRKTLRLFAFTLLLCFVLGGMVLPMASGGFSDLPNSHWAYDDILTAVQEDIVRGYPDGSFHPNDKVTFGEFVKMAVVAKTGIDSGPATTGDWAAHYAALAKDQGMLDGLGGTIPDMGKHICRHEVAAILSSSLSKEAPTLLDTVAVREFFNDLEPLTDVRYVASVVKTGLMTGYGDQSFRPLNVVTRAEAVAVVLRLMDEDARVDAKDYKTFREDVDGDDEEPVGQDSSFVENPETRDGGGKKIPPSESKDRLDLSAFVVKCVELTNVEREKAGVPLLSYSREVSKMAQMKADDMYENDYFSHISPTYGSPSDMINETGFICKMVGENIAYNYKTPEAVIQGWMDSPSHRKALLRERHTHVGFGLSGDKDSGLYWVQWFVQI